MAPADGVRVLVVDDNAGMRRLLRGIVGGKGVEVRECEDGSRALAEYLEFEPDVVLMDIRMPRVDGITATRAITASVPGARIIIVSDFDDRLLRESARQAGALAYVTKGDLTGLGRLVADAARGGT